MKDERKTEAASRGVGTKLMFGVWLVSSIVFLAMVVDYGRRYTPVFESAEVSLPALTVLLLRLADMLQTGMGMIVAICVQAATLIPFAVNRARSLQPKFYAGLAVIGLLALASIWFGLMRPIEQLQAVLAGG